MSIWTGWTASGRIPFCFLTIISFPNYRWRLKKIVIVPLIAVPAVEILEYFSGRYMDIDDIFINICGSVLGYAVYSVMYKAVCHCRELKEIYPSG